MRNIFKNLQYPKAEENEKIEEISSGNSFRIERILSNGQTSADWYDQGKEEFVCLLQGEAKLEYENGEILSLQKGDSLFIPAHQKHKVIYTSEYCIWLCVFEK